MPEVVSNNRLRNSILPWMFLPKYARKCMTQFLRLWRSLYSARDKLLNELLLLMSLNIEDIACIHGLHVSGVRWCWMCRQKLLNYTLLTQWLIAFFASSKIFHLLSLLGGSTPSVSLGTALLSSKLFKVPSASQISDHEWFRYTNAIMIPFFDSFTW